MILERTNRIFKTKIIFISFILIMFLVFFFSMSSYTNMYGLRPLIRNLENKIVLYQTRNFKELETDTFVFRYDDLDNETLELIKNTAEDKYEKIIEIFQYKLKNKILIVIYNNKDLMMDTTMLKRGDPPMGVYYGNSVHISNPKDWIEKTEELEYIFYKEGPMLHELAHLFTDHIGNGNFPMWFTEGVSLYFEYIVDDYEWGKDVIFTDSNNYTIEELNSNFNSLNQYEAYTKSFRLVKNMVDNHGLNKLIDLISSLGKGHKMKEYIYLFEEV